MNRWPAKKAILPPKSDADLMYTLPIWYQTLTHLYPIKALSQKSREFLFSLEKSNFEKVFGPAKKPDLEKITINSVAQYLFDAHQKGFPELNFVYNLDELKLLSETIVLNHHGQQVKTLVLRSPQKKSRRWIIALPSIRDNKYLALHQTYLFTKLGYNVLTFDYQNLLPAESGADVLFNDALDAPYDLAALVDYLKTHFEMESFGLIGNGLGATIALKYSLEIGYFDPKLRFVIADSPFTNLLLELRYFLQEQRELPWWKVSFELRSKFEKYAGFDPYDFDITHHLDRVHKIPWLLMHGLNDSITPSYMTDKLYREKMRAEKQIKSSIVSFPNTKHLEAVSKAHKEYVQSIITFLKRLEEIR